MNNGFGVGYFAGMFWGQSQFGPMDINRVNDYTTKPIVSIVSINPIASPVLSRPNIDIPYNRPDSMPIMVKPRISICKNRPRGIQ